MIDGNYHQLANQAVGVVIAISLSAIGTYIILGSWILRSAFALSAEEEVHGLDLTQHGEEGYYWEVSLP